MAMCGRLRWPPITAGYTAPCARPPAGGWRGVAGGGRPATVTSETAFLVDFLPVIRRMLTRTGFMIDHVQYYSDALKPCLVRRRRLEKFVLSLRRDVVLLLVVAPAGQPTTSYHDQPFKSEG